MGAGVLTASPSEADRAGGAVPESFARSDETHGCGAVSLEALADRYGTPLFVYDGDRILARLAALREAFAPSRPLVAYSVKANPNLAVLGLLAEAGAGADIVSGGELYRCLRAGVPAGKIVFAGVGKTRSEMRDALGAGIKSFHVESAPEMDALGDVAVEMGAAAPMGVRVNPDVASPTHEYTRTGHAAAKFGVAPEQAVALYRRAAAHDGLRPVGIDVHVGSQIREPGPFLRALDVVLQVAERAEREAGVALRYVDMGGGFGIAGGRGGEIDLVALGERVAAKLAGSGRALVVEPGRFLVGDAGVLLTRVLYVKRSAGKTFVVTDAGMTELIRPSHYGGVHGVSPASRPPPGFGAEGEPDPQRRRSKLGAAPEFDGAPESGAAPESIGGSEQRVEKVDVVGPVCEQGDFLARDRIMTVPEPGTILCIHQAGAYAFAMASNYNSRPRPAEVLVRGGEVALVRRRERFSDLVRGEVHA